jgi:uncharacterized protein (UPF0261 family)
VHALMTLRCVLRPDMGVLLAEGGSDNTALIIGVAVAVPVAVVAVVLVVVAVVAVTWAQKRKRTAEFRRKQSAVNFASDDAL